MGELLIRRREMILPSASPTPTPIIPEGYITDGLVFFLDGLQLATANAWTDIVGGKTFSLTDCSVGTNGIEFSSSSFGECAGRITNNWSGETIEAVITGPANSTLNTQCLFAQPYVDDSIGISMRFGSYSSNFRVALGLDGVSRAVRHSGNSTLKKRIGANADRLIVNSINYTSTSSTSYSKTHPDYTTLGFWRNQSGNAGSHFTGTIHAIRIYSRKLSEAEIKANQALDLTRYLS